MTASDKRWALTFFVLLMSLILATAGLLIVTITVLLIVFAGILFGVFLNQLMHAISDHTRLSYRWTYVLVVVVLAGLLGGGAYFAGMRIAQQVAQLGTQLESTFQKLLNQLQKAGWGVDPSELASEAQQIVGGTLMPKLVQAGRWLIWGVTAVVVVLFVGLYVAYDPHLYATGIVRLAPPKRRDQVEALMQTLRSTLSWWIVGRLISMAVIAMATAIGLWLLGVPLPITLGVLAGLLTFIPNIGPILAAVPQALLAFQVGVMTVLYVLLLNIVLQAVESYLITPMVQRYEVSLPPALTICAQLLMTVLLGVIGIIMAAPLTVATIVVLQAIYIRETLDDTDSGCFTGDQP